MVGLLYTSDAADEEDGIAVGSQAAHVHRKAEPAITTLIHNRLPDSPALYARAMVTPLVHSDADVADSVS